MAGVRSATLYAGLPLANTSTQLYAPPEGYTALVKSIFLFSRYNGTAEVFVQLRNQAGIDLPLIHQNITIGNLYQWTGWATLEYLEYLNAFTAQGSVSVWVSGAILPNAL